MKKYIVSIALCIFMGFILSKIFINQYEAKAKNIKYAYFFQVGVYKNLDNVIENGYKYNSYIYVKDKDKYYVFIAISKNKEKLKEYYDNLGIKTYIKELEINDDFDKYLSKIDDDSLIESMPKILRKYEELNEN